MIKREEKRWLGTRMYEEWMQKEGIPVYQDMHGIEDITELPRRPWARLGGSGTFIELEATKAAYKGLYVAEIPAGGALEPEKHLYDEILYILRGRGLAEVWHEGKGKVTFEWGEGSLFAIPLNAWHRLVNGGREPVLVFGQTSAPLVMMTLYNTEFIFNCDYNFTDRYKGEADYFRAVENQPKAEGQARGWATNFVPDLRTVFLDDSPGKVEGGQISGITMASWGGVHASSWPSGKYHKAHYHGPGAVLLGMRGEGYVLIWFRRYGIHPYADGHGDKVVKVPWKKHSIYSPQSEWFHQHFNTGKEPALHLATTGGGLGVALPTLRERPGELARLGFPDGSIRNGGTIIEYEDEDPEIRRAFEKELRQKGIKSIMNPVVYRTDPFIEPF